MVILVGAIALGWIVAGWVGFRLTLRVARFKSNITYQVRNDMRATHIVLGYIGLVIGIGVTIADYVSNRNEERTKKRGTIAYKKRNREEAHFHRAVKSETLYEDFRVYMQCKCGARKTKGQMVESWYEEAAAPDKVTNCQWPERGEGWILVGDMDERRRQKRMKDRAEARAKAKREEAEEEEW